MLSLAHAANDGLHIFDVLRAQRAVEKNVVPVRRIEVLNCSKHQTGIFDLFAQPCQFGDRPKFFRIAGHAPGLILSAGWLIVARIASALLEIIDEVDHHVGASCLPREVVILARQHVPV